MYVQLPLRSDIKPDYVIIGEFLVFNALVTKLILLHTVILNMFEITLV